LVVDRGEHVADERRRSRRLVRAIPFPDATTAGWCRPERDEHPRDADGRCILCAPGEVGEFLGSIPDLPHTGAGRFEGYTDAAATERKILHDVFQKDDRWYRSGDLLRCDEDGYFYFVDRIGDTYRWKSENVSTQEVAEALGPPARIANVYGVRVPGAEGRAGWRRWCCAIATLSTAPRSSRGWRPAARLRGAALRGSRLSPT
jgi:acyl-CoA synthetase (AMP-forming)/AMP-acid ligase II